MNQHGHHAFVLVCRQRFEDRITSRLESGLAAISSMLILLGTSWQSLESRVQGSDYCTELSSPVLSYSTRIELGVIRSTSLPALLHRHVSTTPRVLVRVESE